MELCYFGIFLMCVLTVEAFHFRGWRPRPNRPRPNRRQPNRAPENRPRANIPPENQAQANLPLANDEAVNRPQANRQEVPAVTLLCNDFEVDPEDNRFFIRTVRTSGMTYKQQCPAGTVFVKSMCTCFYGDAIGVVEPLAVPDCNPQAELTFDDGNFIDTSINNLNADINFVNIFNGTALFNGRGKILFDRFSAAEFGQQLEIRLRFKQSDTATGIQTLVSNSDSSNGQSVSIEIDSDNSEVIFYAATDQDTAAVIVPFTSGLWNEVTYTYNGTVLSGKVDDGNNSTATEWASLYGDIVVRESGIIIGGGTLINSFTGSVDDFQLYMCIPS